MHFNVTQLMQTCINTVTLCLSVKIFCNIGDDESLIDYTCRSTSQLGSWGILYRNANFDIFFQILHIFFFPTIISIQRIINLSLKHCTDNYFTLHKLKLQGVLKVKQIKPTPLIFQYTFCINPSRSRFVVMQQEPLLVTSRNALVMWTGAQLMTRHSTLLCYHVTKTSFILRKLRISH